MKKLLIILFLLTINTACSNKVNYTELIAESYFYKAVEITKKNDYKLSFQLYNKSLESLSKLKSGKIFNNKKHNKYIIYSQIGLLFYLNDEYKNALIYFNKALSYSSLNEQKQTYLDIINTYYNLIDKNYKIYRGLRSSDLMYMSPEFRKFLEKHIPIYRTLYKDYPQSAMSISSKLQEVVVLCTKVEDLLKVNDFKNSLKYANQAINKLVQLKKHIRVSYLLSCANRKKSYIFLQKSNIFDAFISAKKAYLFSEEMTRGEPINVSMPKKEYMEYYNNINPDKENSYQNYIKYEKTKYLSNFFYNRENYKEAYSYSNKLFSSYFDRLSSNHNRKISNREIAIMVSGKEAYLNNKIDYLNEISLVLSIAYSYKSSLFTSQEKEKEINKKVFIQWLNYKELSYINEYKKNMDYKIISKQLSKNQLYIDIASGSQNYYIFTLDNKNDITFEKISKKDKTTINKNIHSFRKINQQLAKAIFDEELSNELKNKLQVDTQKRLSALEEIIIKKHLSKQLKNKQELIISPDGLLNFLPFEALYHDGKYLIEDYKISYISSGREFVRQTRREPYVLANRKMICFGNPDFNASIPISQTKGKFGGVKQKVEETWEQFKNFGSIGNEEIVMIGNLYRDVLIYEGKEANVKNLMSVGNSQILHFSTHGKFLNSESIKNPMLKAGLAFSGANKNTANIVTALKISALDLHNTELVVLSACESGLGEVQNAEGVMGLPKAFLQAGARNVMMSLWSVSNQKTAMLMKSFYENVQNGQDYETALRNAKLEMIKIHPYYWSAFIMHGIQN